MQINWPILRGFRAAVFAVVCVLISLAMHWLAGGAPVRPPVLAAAIAMTTAGAFALACRQCGIGTLLPAAFAAQYGLHHLFTAFGADHRPNYSGHHGGDLPTGIGMVLAHALVAVLSAWWLDRGETALIGLLCLLASSLHFLWLLLASLWASPVLPAPRRSLVADAARLPTGVLVLAGTLSRRGPPVR